jgi:penicillin-binding protein 1C
MKRPLRSICGAALVCVFLMGLLSVIGLIAAQTIPLPERLAFHDSVVVEYHDGEPAYVFLTDDEKWRISPSTHPVSKRYIDALVAFEDQRFWSHPGVDPIAIMRATVDNLVAGRVVSGASTLTMQVVRILEPRPRTLRSKGIEALRAMQLELRLSKEEILAAYLRFAPFGKNIEGIGSASISYFGHTSKDLSPAEIAVLIAVPQDPSNRYPRKDHQKNLKKARTKVANRLARVGQFTTEERDEVLADRLPKRLQPFPREAPHASTWLARKSGAQRVRTTLRRDVQRKAEKVLRNHEKSARNAGIPNATMVVMDVEKGEAIALVGNFDFFDTDNAGQVPGFLAPRSPGSALKPFIYGLAIDEGLAMAEHLVPDTPVRFGSYAPKNYDGDYRGMVTFEDALSQSLNIPFVNGLRDVGVKQFYRFLTAHGFNTLLPESAYGLSMAIGAVDVTPLSLTNLYAMVAREGRYLPVRTLHNNPVQEARAAFTPGTSWLVRRALTRRDRPDFPDRRAHVQLAPRVFWKTGTSYGHRDAWALGGDDRYVVGVWMGSFEGQSSRSLVGATRSGPVFFDMMDALANRALQPIEDQAPEDLAPVEVCSLSGRIPGTHCRHTTIAFAPRRSVSMKRCTIHQQIAIDDKTGYRLCPICSELHSHKMEVHTVFPPDVQRYLHGGLLAGRRPPKHLPACDAILPGQPPKIASPHPGTTVMLIPGLDPQRQQIPLEVLADPAASSVYWFINGELLAKASPSEKVWLTPSLGHHELRVTDEAGQTDTLRLVVE